MNRQILCAGTMLISVALGCRPAEEITTYTASRTEPPREVIDYSMYARRLDHTLAAILPQGKRAWFFKLSAPASVVDRQRDGFLTYLKSVSPGATDEALPTWQLPAGWEEKEPTSEFISKVIAIPDESGPVELTVSSLDLAGDWNDFVARNVNRWLGQLNQGPLEAAHIAKLTQQVATAAGPATVIELAGVNQQAARSGSSAEAEATPRVSSPTGGPLKFETPAGWQPGRTSAMRTAAFTIADGAQQAEATVIALPTTAGPQITDVGANVQRWAGQVGLENLNAAALAKLTRPVSIDGAEGTFVALLGPPEGERPMGLLAAMVEKDDKVWFFKLTGDRTLVESQQAAFDKFLESVRFQ